MDKLAHVPYKTFQELLTADISFDLKVQLFSELCRINILYMVSRAGSGHLGTSFSSIDIMSYLYLEQYLKDGSLPLFFSSKGHDIPALYSVLTALGLIDFDYIHKFRRLNGLPGHPDISTPGIVTNTGSLGMGISKAKGVILANRLDGKRLPVYVMTGDGELQEGQIWESLVSAANLGLTELTVIVDHNKIQSDRLVALTSNLGDLKAKFQSFGWNCSRCDGHSTDSFRQALADCRSIADRPGIIIADTVKGKGVSFMERKSIGNEGHEMDLYQFHSGAPAKEVYFMAVAELAARTNNTCKSAGFGAISLIQEDFPQRSLPNNTESLIQAYSQALLTQGINNPKIVVLDADLAKDCGLLPFQERLPERFFECGIAEQDMVSQAGGFALKGYLPIVHSFSCFLSARPNEQIYNNATENTKIIYVGSLAGVTPAAPGHSHQAVRDFASLGAVPGLTIIAPSNSEETRMAVQYCIEKTTASCYIRLESVPCAIPFTLPETYQLETGKGIAIHEGTDAIIFGYGPTLLTQLFHAAQLASEQGISFKIVNLPWINLVDSSWLAGEIGSIPFVFTVDNHYISGGQGEMLCCQIAEIGINTIKRIKRLGLTAIPACGTNDEALHCHRLDSRGLYEDIVAYMRGAK